MRILYIEPFDAGSHAAFTQSLTQGIDAQWTVLTLPGRHWKWRMRGAVPLFALERKEALEGPHDLVFASAYVPLVELVGLCPALASVPRLLYFHENQLAYPAKEGIVADRDLHFGFSQLVSALAAQRCLFNSAHNRDSFLEAADDLLGRMPDFVPTDWVERVRERACVMPLPLALPPTESAQLVETETDRAKGPILLWNHRWEYDKAPETFFEALRALDREGVPFRVAVCGQRFRRVPICFEEARAWLGDRVVHWGYVEDAADYRALLHRSQVVVSTAIHEFFGVSVLEAVHLGARPLVPDRLAYRESIPESYRYGNDADLAPALADLCRRWVAGEDLRGDRRDVSGAFGGDRVLPRYAALFREVIETGA